MTAERKRVIQFKGEDMTVVGDDLRVGDQAPEFRVQTQAWTEFRGLEETQGKVRIVAAVPSLDTDVCDRETRRFNEEASSLSEDIAILVISMDLPLAQKRWCGAAGVDRVMVLSDHMEGDFGRQYGCLMKEVRLLRRAVFVIGKAGKVVYAAYMPALGTEPDYGAVLEAAKGALAEGGQA